MRFSYFLLRVVLFPFSFLSYKTLRAISLPIGSLLYHLMPTYRKRIQSNLSLAKDLALAPAQIPPLAKKVLASLVQTCLEYGKLYRKKDLSSLAVCKNPKQATDILATGKGVIFLCAHQANWELFFLEGTSRMPGVAIGQPIKNRFLYQFIIRIREKNGGTMVLPQEAVKEGLRALKQGKFLGIVGDQGMPQSGFCAPFLGAMAYTSPLPAILAHRTGCPIVTATMRRGESAYEIHYSDPLWPDLTLSADKDVPRLMQKALSHLEESIKQRPEEWLFSHNKWKQQTLGRVKKIYRQDAILVIVDNNPSFLSELSILRKIYPSELLGIWTPHPLDLPFAREEFVYHSLEDLYIPDYRWKLLLDFTNTPSLAKHFERLSVIQTETWHSLAKKAKLSIHSSFSDLLQGALLEHAR